jgi:hypothetical protein
LTVDETEVECPICTFRFDAESRMAKAKLPVFKMKCPGCKSYIGISLPIFGGVTKCFEWEADATGNRLKTESEFKIFFVK